LLSSVFVPQSERIWLKVRQRKDMTKTKYCKVSICQKDMVNGKCYSMSSPILEKQKKNQKWDKEIIKVRQRNNKSKTKK
jgi:hypothetical protein